MLFSLDSGFHKNGLQFLLLCKSKHHRCSLHNLKIPKGQQHALVFQLDGNAIQLTSFLVNHFFPLPAKNCKDGININKIAK